MFLLITIILERQRNSNECFISVEFYFPSRIISECCYKLIKICFVAIYLMERLSLWELIVTISVTSLPLSSWKNIPHSSSQCSHLRLWLSNIPQFLFTTPVLVPWLSVPHVRIDSYQPTPPYHRMFYWTTTSYEGLSLF